MTTLSHFIRFGIIPLLGVACLATADAQQPIEAVRRWAFVSADTMAQPLTDLLTVEFSGQHDVELVERDQITRVLGELELTAQGLTDSSTATRLGNIAKADVLVIVSGPQDPQDPRTTRPRIRIRMIDTRTSIRLLDAQIPRTDVETEVAALAEELRSAAATLNIPEDQLRLISMVPVASGEPGYTLDSYCQTLTALVAAEFHRRPEFVLLERSDLQRLTAERDLSGIELRLRGATRLIETSVQRTPDRQGIAVTCRIVSPGTAQQESWQFVVPSMKPTDARSLLIEAVLKRLSQAAAKPTIVTPQQEAITFDRRARWLTGEASVAMAEAAVALSATRERVQIAENLNFRLAYENHRAKKTRAALLAMYRSSQHKLQLVKTYGLPYQPPQYLPLYTTFLTPLGGKTAEEKRLIADISNLQRSVLEHQRQHAESSLARIDYNLRLIDLELRWQPDTLRPAERVVDLLRECFEMHEDAGIKPELSDPYFNDMIRELVRCIDRVHDANGQSDRFFVEDLNAWGTQLKRLDETFTRAAFLKHQSNASDAAGLEAARELVDLLHQIPLVDTQYVDMPFRTAALTRITPQELFDYFTSMLTRCESSTEPSEVLVFGNQIAALLKRLPEEQAQHVARRMIRLLKMDHERNSFLATTPMLAALAQFVPRTESPFLRPAKFSLENAPGAWNQYRAVPIQLNVLDKRRLHSWTVQAGTAGNEQLVLVWSVANQMTSVETISSRGGTPAEFGSAVSGFPRYRPLLAAASSQAVFLAGRDTPLTMITQENTRLLNEIAGAASDKITAIAWCDDQLMIGYDGALGSYNPQTDTFSLIASSSSVNATNPLDSRGRFSVSQIIPDREGSFWINIRDFVEPRQRMGIWYCHPRKNVFEQITNVNSRMSKFEGGLLVHQDAAAKIVTVDLTTRKLTEHPEFAQASKPAVYSQPGFRSPYATSYTLPNSTLQPYLIKIGDHLIGSDCTLSTSDGKKHQLDNMLPWIRLLPFGKGFLTHYESATKTIWYVEPKLP